MTTESPVSKSNRTVPFTMLSVVGIAIGCATLLLVEQDDNSQQTAQAADATKRSPQESYRSTRDQVSRALVKQVFAQLNRQNTKGKKPNVEQLRKQYPLESLRQRLAYESRLQTNRPQPKLTAAATKRLEREEASQLTYFMSVRRKSLQALHSANAQQFINQSGFGRSRMGFSPSPVYLPTPSPELLPLAQGPRLTPDSTATANIDLPLTDAPTVDNPFQMPSRSGLLDFHVGSRLGFLSPATFGYVKSRDQVAGFASHAFTVMPQLHGSKSKPKNKSRTKADGNQSGSWLIRRLELVSLLVHKTPRVYVSKHLPRMDELSGTETRPLTAHERRGLQQLRSGEDLAVEAAPNAVRMVGSLRATKRCLECHSVQRGELLGAFTYLLQRNPPIRVQPPSDVPAA